MTPSDWIQLIGLIGAVAGFIYWVGQRDAKSQQSIATTEKLEVAVVGLTAALNGATTEIRELKAEVKTWKQSVDETHEAMWGEIAKLRDRA